MFVVIFRLKEIPQNDNQAALIKQFHFFQFYLKWKQWKKCLVLIFLIIDLNKETKCPYL